MKKKCKKKKKDNRVDNNRNAFVVIKGNTKK
jgi:hypothetical protein